MKRMVLVLCALCVVNTTAQAEIHPVWGAEIVSVDPDPMFGYELAVDSEYGAPSAMFPEGMDVDVRGESPCAPVDALTGEELHTALLAGLYWNMFKPVWSPDGNWIATNSAQGGIFVIPAGGGEPVFGESGEHGNHEVRSVDLEKSTQRLSSIGAAEAVGSQHVHIARRPASSLLWNEGHPVRDRDDWAFAVVELTSDHRNERLVTGRQAVATVAVEGIGA